MATKKRPDQTGEEKIAELKVVAIAAAEVVYHYKIVANSIGYSEDGLKVWRENDKDFSDKLEQARSRFLSKQIKKAKPEFLLERLEPEVFKRREEQDVTVTMPKPILGGLTQGGEE
ncbi:hypothetical protein GS464_29575 [Rhodococcus hoagii]|nr:hypothetical protein [Prescottella equi]MBM4646568.1 hypothetical protein [Prescottella equi]